MRIFVDGVIFSRQQRGGISRTYNELLPRITEVDPSVAFTLYLRRKLRNGPLPVSPCIRHVRERSIYPWRFLAGKLRVQQVLMQRAYEADRPDIFHATYFTSPSKLKSRYILSIYDMIDERFAQSVKLRSCQQVVQQKRECARVADLIISNSEWTTRDIVEYYRIPTERIVTIPLGVGPEFHLLKDGEKRNEFSARHGLTRPFFLYVGAKRFNKNIMVLLKGYAACKFKREIDLVFVGDGDDFRPREREVISASLREGTIRNLGVLNQEQLVVAYNSAVALILPSLHEGFGLPVLEAMACGTPVVASNATSLPEVGGDAALYFDPSDSDALAHGLETIVSPSVRQDLIARGMARAAKFTWERTAKLTVEAYRKLV
jgi:glycosyltransferase involved in cell wall biosynthesis